MTDTPQPQETRQEPCRVCCSRGYPCGFCGRIGQSSSPREPQKDETLTALKNSGIDVTCGACMEVAYTGVTTNAHTCKSEPREPHAALIAELEWCRDNGCHGPRTEKAIIAAIGALKGE